MSPAIYALIDRYSLRYSRGLLMKKVFIYLTSTLLLLASVSPVFAYSSEKGFYDIGTATGLSVTCNSTSGTVDILTEDVDENGTSDVFYAGADLLEITYDQAVAGEEYLAMLVRGTELPDNLADSKYYDIRQATASSTTVSFSLYPKGITNSMQMTLFITNSNDEALISIPLKYWDGHPAYLIGDGNDDGKANSKDRVLLTRYLASWEGIDSQIVKMDAFDINGDGNISAKDRVIFSRYLARWGGSYNAYFEQ